jgi:hypothetical protein
LLVTQVSSQVSSGNLGDVALAVERRPVGVQPGGDPGGRDLQPRRLDAVRLIALDQCVVIGHEEKALHPRLAAGFDAGAHRADVVAEVQGAGGGDAGEDACWGPWQETEVAGLAQEPE